MKVYFSASARAKKEYQKSIGRIYSLIKKFGGSHVTDFIVKVDPEDFYQYSHKQAVSFYKKMVNGIKQADICIFETSKESAGIGYSVNLALDAGKPVIALHRPYHKPYLLQMINHPKIQVVEYKDSNLEAVFKKTWETAKEQMDTRFTFFLTPKLANYLDFIKRDKKLARAAFIRGLIEKSMKTDKRYLKNNT